MTTANEHGVDDQAYRRGALVLTHTDSQEELERAKAGMDSETFDPAYFSHDPRGEKQRPAFERTRYMPKPCSFNQILELWAAHEGGRLLRIIHVPGKDNEARGEDDARRAWEWVATVPGWGKTVHEVMRHLVLRSLAWNQWPVAAAVKCMRVETGGLAEIKDDEGKVIDRKPIETGPEYRSYCDWPFVTYEQAGAAWLPFYRALRKKYRLDPFTIEEQIVELA